MKKYSHQGGGKKVNGMCSKDLGELFLDFKQIFEGGSNKGSMKRQGIFVSLPVLLIFN